MSRVDVTEDVGFEGSVHSDKAETADDFRIVGNFARTDNHFVAEEFNVAEEFVHCFVRECEGASTTEAAFAHFHQFENGILDNFGIHVECRNFLAFAKSVEHGVCNVAHT